MTWMGMPADREGLAVMHFALDGDTYMLVSVEGGRWRTIPPHVHHSKQDSTVVFPR